MTANQIAYAKYQEDVRSHMVNEDLQRAANAIGLRNAMANESNAAANSLNASTRRDELNETIRSNMMREIETQRSNMAKEAEQHRSNAAQESIAASYNQARIAQGEQSLWNESRRNDEEYRHNLVTEGQQNKNILMKGAETIGNFFGKVVPVVAGLLA